MSILKSNAARAIALIAFVVLAVVGWLLVSPLFIDRAVDEALPTLEQLDAMSESEKAGVMDDVMADAARQPDREMSDPMPANTPAVLAQGQFSDADVIHKGEGRAVVYDLGGGNRVLRFEDFRVTNGPDLRVWLTSAQGEITADAVKAAEFRDLGALKGNVGSQNYTLPSELDLANYTSVVIWCRAFGVLFSPAPLNPT
ncbi:MAG: DM13 domain-containing protein [Pseudomonadota bacterium]